MHVLCKNSAKHTTRSSGPIEVVVDGGAMDLASFSSKLGADYRAFKVKEGHEREIKLGASFNVYGYDAVLTDITPEEQLKMDKIRAISLDGKEVSRGQRREKAGLDVEPPIKFRNSSQWIGHQGEGFKLSASLDRVGVIAEAEYVVAANAKIAVERIHVDPKYRRLGFGTEVLREIQRLNPGIEIKFPFAAPGSEAENFLRNIPRFIVSHPECSRLAAEYDGLLELAGSLEMASEATTLSPLDDESIRRHLELSKVTGRLNEIQELQNLFRHSKSSVKILDRQQVVAAFSSDTPSVFSDFQDQMAGRSTTSNPPTKMSSPSDFQARSAYLKAQERLDIAQEKQSRITSDFNKRLKTAREQRFTELFGKRRRYSATLMSAQYPEEDGKIFAQLDGLFKAECEKHHCSPVHITEFESVRDKAAINAPILPGERTFILKGVSESSYSTQGFGAEKYARSSAEMAELNAQYLGIPSEVISETHEIVTGASFSGASSHRTSFSEFYTVGRLVSQQDLQLFRNKPSAPFKEVLRMLMKRGSNPRVFFPMLPHGAEHELGLDHFGNDLQKQTPEVKSADLPPPLTEEEGNRLDEALKRLQQPEKKEMEVDVS